MDELLYDSMTNVTEWADLWDLTRKLLLFSDRQASVERGFSINSEISVESNILKKILDLSLKKEISILEKSGKSV